MQKEQRWAPLVEQPFRGFLSAIGERKMKKVKQILVSAN